MIKNAVNPAIFRAYDIRGIYPEEINEEVIRKIAAALAKFFKKGEVVIGHDTRLSSPRLYRALINKLASRNPELKIVSVGLITTPMLYFLVGRLKAKGGIIIAASHNPKEYNGLKTVRAGSMPVSGKEIQKLVMRN